MNPFSVLESDDEAEVTSKKQNNKKTTTATPNPDNAPLTEKAPTGGRGGGRGHAKGGRGTSGRGKNGKREFDRHSGTGRGKEVSKGGAGKGNWGSEKEEAHDAEKNITHTEDANGNNEVDETPAEPEVPTFTMDEYLARRAATSKPAAAFGNVEERKPVTGDFAGMKTKEDDQSDFMGGVSKAKAEKAKQQRSSDKKVIADLGFKSEPPREEREERRGGRGEGRGGRGRGEGRGRGRGEGRGEGRGAPRPSNKLDLSATAFPTLGK